MSGARSSMGSDACSSMVEGGGGDRVRNFGEDGVGVHQWTFRGKYHSVSLTKKKKGTSVFHGTL